MEKREGTERRVCVHFIYMVEATERYGTYLLIPVKRELVACQSTKGGNRKGGRGSERKKERKRMKDSAEVFGRRAKVDTIVDPCKYIYRSIRSSSFIPCVNPFN